MSTTPLLDWVPPQPFTAKGSTFDAKRDGARLGEQCARVFKVMQSGHWQTLASIAAITLDPEASVSARLRDLRRFGMTIERAHVSRGLWKYRLVA